MSRSMVSIKWIARVSIFFVSCIFLALPFAYSQILSEPEPSSKFESFIEKCDESGCSIFPYEGEVPTDPYPIYNSDQTQCYNAIPVPENIDELPNVFAFVGGDQKHFFRPIHEHPKNVLEAGDILVYFRDISKDDSNLYAHVTKGRWHAAIIGEDDEGLFRLDSPASLSGRNLANGTFHILRLRKDLEGRGKYLKDMNEYVLQLRQLGYSYDSHRKTEASILSSDEIRRRLNQGDRLSLYCSELPATICVLSGLPLPRAYSLSESIDRVEAQILDPLLQRNPELSKSEVVEMSLKEFFSDTTLMREMGATGAELNRYSLTGELPATVERMKELYRALFLMRSEARHLAIRAQENFDRDKGQFVGPSDLFDSIFDPQGSLSYVGTYVGQRQIGGGQQMAHLGDSAAEGGSVYRDMSSHPHGLFSEKLHRLEISSLRFSPSGRFVVTGSGDETAKVISVETGNEILSISHTDYVESAEFSPDEKSVVTASRDNTAKVFSLESGEEILTVRHSDEVNSARFSPDGRFAATTSKGNASKIVSLATAEAISIEPGEGSFDHPYAIVDFQFAPDSKSILMQTSAKNRLGIFSTETGELVSTIEKEAQYVKRIQFSSDGKYFLTTGLGIVEVYSWDTRLKLFELRYPDHSTPVAEFSPDGSLIASAFHDGSVRIISMETEGENFNISHADRVNVVSFSPDGKFIFTGSRDGRVRITSLETGAEVSSIDLGPAVYKGAFSPDGRFVAIGSSAGGLHFFSPYPLLQANLEDELSDYNSNNYFLEQNSVYRDQHRAYLRLLFEKAKRDHNMTREQAVKLMNTYVQRAAYRGWYDASERRELGADAHIYGVINAVFPSENDE